MKDKIKATVFHLVIGVSFPLILILNAFMVPIPYSAPLIEVATAPIGLLPFLDNRDLLKELTIAVFGRTTANFAPITILILAIFWFIIGVINSLFYKYIREN